MRMIRKGRQELAYPGKEREIEMKNRADYPHRLITYNPSRGWYERDSPLV